MIKPTVTGHNNICEYTGKDFAHQKDVEVSPYHCANWLTKEGVYKKQKLIEAKGLPSFYGWRFITLTIDQKLFKEGPGEAYLAGKKYMRNFIVKLRKLLGCRAGVKWCWKLEFQQNGWPHWHLCLDHDFIEPELLPKINKLWRFGRTNVERIEERGKGFFYQFKYAFKPVYQEETDDFQILPQWWLDFQRIELVPLKDEFGKVMKKEVTLEDGSTAEITIKAYKKKTLSRARFWQTSQGFFDPYPDPDEEPEEKAKQERKPQYSSLLPRLVRRDSEELLSKIQVKARGADGRYRKSAVVTLTTTAAAFFSVCGVGTLHAEAAPTYNKSYVVKADVIKQHINQTPKQIWQLQQIQKLNQITVQRVLQHLTLTRMMTPF